MSKINIESVSYTLGILSIVFGLLTPLAGLVVGIIGLNQSKEKKFVGARRLNIIGIIVSVLMLIATVAILLSGNWGELTALQ